MELISGREEESEHKEGLSSAVCQALRLTLLWDVLDPGASSNVIQVGLLALLSDVTLVGVSDIFLHTRKKPKPATGTRHKRGSVGTTELMG